MRVLGATPAGGLAGGGSASWLGLLRRLLWLGLALLALGFVAAAITRRLNFDEALALRSGWLAVQRLAGAPPFYMPTTLLLGALGSAVTDPAAVMLIARLAVVATVGPALFWAQQPVVEVWTVALRAPWGQMQGATPQAMRVHRRGVATPQMAPCRPQPEGRQGVSARLRRCSSSTMSPHRLLLAPCMRTESPCRATIQTSTTGC